MILNIIYQKKMVNNKKQQVFFKKYRKDLYFVFNRWKYLNRKYKLGTSCIIDFNDSYGLLSVKSFDINRLRKMDTRWKKQIIRTSAYCDKNRNKFGETPNGICMLYGETKGNISKFHCGYINRLMEETIFGKTSQFKTYIGEFGR